MFALLSSTLVNTTGDGLYIAGSALFFTRGLGLPVAKVGLGLTCAGIVGLTAGVPLGRLADRRGPREVLIAIQLVQAVAIGSYVLVGRSLGAFVLVATVCIAGMQGADAAKGALVGRLASADPVGLRAMLQSVSNIGISVGTVLAGLALAAGTHLAYQSLMLGDAASFLGGALLLLPVPQTQAAVHPSPGIGRRRWLALRDRPYVALTAANCVMALQFFVLAFAMPLWVIGHTRAPRWLVSPMLLTNTVLIVLLQVRFSRSTKTAGGGARSIRRAGMVLAASMLLYSVASGVGELTAAAILLAAVIAHTIGELLQSAGTFGVSYGLAPEAALGGVSRCLRAGYRYLSRGSTRHSGGDMPGPRPERVAIHWRVVPAQRFRHPAPRPLGRRRPPVSGHNGGREPNPCDSRCPGGCRPLGSTTAGSNLMCTANRVTPSAASSSPEILARRVAVRRGCTNTMRARVARHTNRLEEVVACYRDRVGLLEAGRFADHEGYELGAGAPALAEQILARLRLTATPA